MSNNKHFVHNCVILATSFLMKKENYFCLDFWNRLGEGKGLFYYNTNCQKNEIQLKDWGRWEKINIMKK